MKPPMKALKIIIVLTMFLAIGEGLMRFDQAYKPFTDEKAVVAIEAKIVESEIYRGILQGTYKPKEDVFKIMVLGDSFVHGGGINYQEALASNLKNILTTGVDTCGEIEVLDLSRPGHNTADNFNIYRAFKDFFKPNIVVLGYVLRDVLGPMIIFDTGSTNFKLNDGRVGNLNTPEKINKDIGIYRIINPIRRNSRLFKFVNTNVQRLLKINGIVIPYFGSLHHIVNSAYTEDSKNWLASKDILTSLRNETNSDSGHLVVYYIPEMNVLEHASLYSKPDKEIDRFFRSLKGISYINGYTDDFRDNPENDQYYISKFDAHPNELAHRMIAQSIADTIRSSWKCET